MFQQLVSHNEDIGRLVAKGYAVGCDSNYLIVRDIPYLNDKRELVWGAIVSKLVAIDTVLFVQDNHQVFFAGGVPHGIDGNPISNLAGRTCGLALGDAASDVVVQRRFSNKPTVAQKFVDFFEKIESYVTIISGPAMALHGADPLTFRVVEGQDSASVFKVHDTLTSRAEITDLSEKFCDDVIAIIGLGGTGSYLLDFMVKTPVDEVRAFDSDVFHVHNAFRSPGRTEEHEFSQEKAEVYGNRYANFRNNLTAKAIFIDEDSADELDGVTFAFVCVDKGSSRSAIFEVLLARRIPFIDVGMGLKRRGDALSGMARMTYYSATCGPETIKRGFAELADDPEDMYRTNIQIAELNALNAAFAIIRYKQIRGFYFDETCYVHLLFDLSDLKTVGETEKNED